MRGRVRNITTFGVFVEIEPGIDGLVHISDLSWTRKIKHPSEVVKKGQQMDVVVLNIDSSERRISLGHKQVSTNPWVEFEEAYAEGTTTTGKVVDIDDKGIVVELPLEVEAFMPIGELKNGSTLRNSYAEGQILEGITVIRLDLQQKEITVSETAEDRMRERAERKAEEQKRRKEQAEERKAVETYTRQGSGPATLGELSDLAALRTQMADAEDAAAAEAAAEAAEEAPVADAPAADAAPEAAPDADDEEKDA
jgi:small subunit ribosomal protein S1